jgi:long-chain acyl-CoA synthetase
LTAIVCIDLEAAGHWAEGQGVTFTSYAELSQRPEICELIAGVLRHVNETLLEPLRIRRFVNLHKEFDADDGEITRTRKLRRNVIEERYAGVIDALYSGARSVVENTRITYESGEIGTISRTLAVCEVG